MSILYTVSNINSLHAVSDPDTIEGMTSFGDKLRAQRKARGLSQERLAEMMQYQRTNLVNIEAGKKKASDEVLKKLASVKELEVTYEQLKGWQLAEMFPPEVIRKAFEIVDKERGL